MVNTGVIMSTRKPRSPKFKLKVALEALSGKQTIAEISQQYEVAESAIHKWKRQLQDDGETVFIGSKKATPAKDTEKELAKLYAKIGQLTIERDFLKKNLGE